MASPSYPIQQLTDKELVDGLKQFGEIITLPLKSPKREILIKKLNHYKARKSKLESTTASFQMKQKLSDEELVTELRSFGEIIKLPIKSHRRDILRKKLNHYRVRGQQNGSLGKSVNSFSEQKRNTGECSKGELSRRNKDTPAISSTKNITTDTNPAKTFQSAHSKRVIVNTELHCHTKQTTSLVPMDNSKSDPLNCEGEAEMLTETYETIGPSNKPFFGENNSELPNLDYSQAEEIQTRLYPDLSKLL